MKYISLLFLCFALSHASLYPSAPGTGKNAAENGAAKVSLRAQFAALIAKNAKQSTAAVAQAVQVKSGAEVVHKVQDQKNAVGTKKEKNQAYRIFTPERLGLAALLSEKEKKILGIQEPLVSEVLGKVTVRSRPATGGAPEVDSQMFNEFGYFIDPAHQHKRGVLVAVLQDKQYKLGLVLGMLDDTFYLIQFEKEQAAKISKLNIAIRPVQK